MKTKKLGKHGPELSVIGLGAWAIGGPWLFGWGKQNDNDSIRTIHRALDEGINWIDTAAVYGLGHSEKILARALENKRSKVFIATKCGLVWNSKGKVRNDLSPASIRKEIEDSLIRLDTDYIDLYQFHWPDPNTAVEKSWETMMKLKQEGKVRCVGVSNFNVELMQKCMKLEQIDSLQPPYNLFDRGVEKDILPFAEKNGIGVIPYSPMKSGLLSGNFDISKIAPDDWRRKNDDFSEPKLSRNLQFVEDLRPIAEKHNASIGELAIAWVLLHSAVTAAIVGARRPAQIQETVKAAGIKLDESDLTQIKNLISNLAG